MSSPLSAEPRSRSARTAFAVAFATVFAVQAQAQGPRLERLATLDLPEEVAAARDVRWREDGALLLGVSGNGIYAWAPGAERAELATTLAGRSDAHHSQNYANLGGASAGSLAFSSGTYGIYRQDDSGIRSFKDIEVVGDIDRRHGRTVAVGLSRGPDGDWENQLAWLISDDGSVRGILPRRAPETSSWSLAGPLGVARILSEDQVLIIPGLEPDVFIYDWDGRLLNTLKTATFYADSPWRITPEQVEMMSSPSWYLAWLSRHRLIDEVVADDRGNVFFFVRRVLAELPYPEAADKLVGSYPLIDQSGKPKRVALTEGQIARMQELLQATGHTLEGQTRIKDPAVIAELDRIAATSDVPAPQRTRVCWDLVHAHVDNLQTATKADCVVEAEVADTRLRADLRGDKAVVLLLAYTSITTQMRPSEVFEARLIPPGNPGP